MAKLSDEIPGIQDERVEKFPGDEDFARRGHGTGLRAHSNSKSAALADGKTMRFAWMWPGAMPLVGVVRVLEREARRAERPLVVGSAAMIELN